jgi:transcriptional regulator NrdR family protein
MSFHCPLCDSKTRVTSTRAEIRERKCLNCSHAFRTEEIEYDGKMPWDDREHHPMEKRQ